MNLFSLFNQLISSTPNTELEIISVTGNVYPDGDWNRSYLLNRKCRSISPSFFFTFSLSLILSHFSSLFKIVFPSGFLFHSVFFFIPSFFLYFLIFSFHPFFFLLFFCCHLLPSSSIFSSFSSFYPFFEQRPRWTKQKTQMDASADADERKKSVRRT